MSTPRPFGSNTATRIVSSTLAHQVPTPARQLYRPAIRPTCKLSAISPGTVSGQVRSAFTGIAMAKVTTPANCSSVASTGRLRVSGSAAPCAVAAMNETTSGTSYEDAPTGADTTSTVTPSIPVPNHQSSVGDGRRILISTTIRTVPRGSRLRRPTAEVSSPIPRSDSHGGTSYP
jgi:hypothetical protein